MRKPSSLVAKITEGLAGLQRAEVTLCCPRKYIKINFQNLNLTRPDPLERTARDILRPYLETPVSSCQEVLRKERIPLESSDRSMMSSVSVEDNVSILFALPGAAEHSS